MNIQESINPNLKSNRVPSSDEVVALRSLIRAETVALESVKTSLAQAEGETITASKRVEEARLTLEAALSALSAAQETAATLSKLLEPIELSIRQKKGILHPLRRFPPELLLEIFQYRIDQDEWDRDLEADLDGEWGICDGPLVLSAVSSRWRNLVQSKDTLWRHFNVSLHNFIPKFVKSPTSNPFIDRLSHWATLSGESNVDISIRKIGDKSDPDGLKAAVMFRRILISFNGRIRRMQMLFAGSDALIPVLGPGITGDIPSLRHLSVHMSEAVSPGIAIIPTGAFRESQHLQTIQLRNSWWSQRLQLQELTTFDVYNPYWHISPQGFLKTIAGCSNLRHMPIEFDHKPVVVQSRDFFQLENLESLHTTCEWITLAGPILDQCMIAPKLTNLELYGRGEVSAIAEFIHSVAPNVRQLRLGLQQDQGDDTAFDLVSILRSAKKLVEFAIDNVLVDAAFFQALGEEGSNMSCPLLTSLIFKDVTITDPSALLQMVQSRTRPGLNGETSIPRRLMVLGIQGEKQGEINAWYAQQIDELMNREDDGQSPMAEGCSNATNVATEIEPDQAVTVE
ncbi:hypothetical protein FS842_009285 [Serendipita sp. 407]|nr:hypothetical protein FS842_009285 [Serendipita sp. 407]